ncbi:MAG: hypothetical protein ACLTSX_07265 [Collinsella sp.]
MRRDGDRQSADSQRGHAERERRQPHRGGHDRAMSRAHPQPLGLYRRADERTDDGTVDARRESAPRDSCF